MVDKKEAIGTQLCESAELMKIISEKYVDQIVALADIIARAIKQGNKLLICGNGGSAADAQHFAAEMIGRLKQERPSLPAIALTTDTSILTAVGNDYTFQNIFVRQIEGLGNKEDVLLGISTSGNSANVELALTRAKSKEMIPVGLLGGDGGRIAAVCDLALIVPSNDSQRIQEAHIAIIHILCSLIEQAIFF